ncbi:Sensory/regulatory protein RpfC [Gimesia maris]|uniref:CheR family methyltransferase n=1 Tax=Gimesia maris TaxID=122 RepID=UPI00118D5948|nr:CheR family methyltransferase [Gimesia maris]QDT78510.1 Sensory/regulatory protein RpfC [Gimesia maris]
MPKSAEEKHIQNSSTLIVVAIGASAGGLNAVKNFFSTIKARPGYAIVVIQHMLPEGAETLLKTMEQFCPLPVSDIDQNTQVKKNHVYIAPPHCSVQFDDAPCFSASAVMQEGQGTPVINPSFRSLAEIAGSNAVGIILSGMGSDGTYGLNAIREAGGMTMVQDPESSEYDDMPASAIHSENIDYVLQPAQMPAELDAYLIFLNRRTQRKIDEQDLLNEVENHLPRICDQLLEATNHDFRHYKTGTLIRRIIRRMQVLRFNDVNQYLSHLSANRDESQALFRELLISVTAFFRDPKTFAILAENYIPSLFENRERDQSIRIWVPGCASGEEAYSLAMLLYEAREQAKIDVEMHVFATDIDERALAIGREAVYPLSIEEHVSQERLERFFIKKGKHYRVVKEIRELCVFSTHNLISDPPFSQLDLISCRNLLIYLDASLQQRIVPVFHFALKQNGLLLLGPSENMMMHTDMFRPLDKKHCISQRKSVPIQTSALRYTSNRSRNYQTGHESLEVQTTDIPGIAQRILLAEYAPRYAVVSEESHILTTSAGIEQFLEFPDGSFHNNLIKMTRTGLRNGLRTALTEACRTREKVEVNDLSYKTASDLRRARLAVHPLPEISQDTELFLVIFEDQGPIVHHTSFSDRTNANAAESDSVIEQLESELERTRTELENSVQELEGSNEELNSSNEELLSINEELQSANEELETSKEEIQASMEALTRAQSDLENLLNGTKIATIYLDRQMLIKSFTTSAKTIYNLNATDVGRPLSDITHNVKRMPKIPSLENTRKQNGQFEDEMQLKNGTWLLRRILPYESDGEFDGMILTFLDVTEFKLAEIRLETEHAITQLLAEANSLKEIDQTILQTIRKCLQASVGLLWLPDKSYERLVLETSVATNVTKNREFLKSNTSIQFACGEGLPGTTWQNMQTEWCEDIQTLVWYNRSEAASKSGLVSGIAIPIIFDRQCQGIMEFYTREHLKRDPLLANMFSSIGYEIGSFLSRCRIQDQLYEEVARKNAILSSAIDCIITTDAAGNIVDFNPAAERTFGYTAQEVIGKTLCDLLLLEEYHERYHTALEQFLKTGESDLIGRHIELPVMHQDGSHFPVELAISVTHLEDGHPFFTLCLRDISLRKQQEEALRDSEGRSKALVEASAHMVWTMTPDARTVEDSPTWREFTGQTYEEWKDKGWIDGIHPDDREQTLRNWQTAFESVTPLDCEYRLCNREGEWCWTSVRAVPQINSEGTVLRWVGMNLDITRQKHLQQEVEANEKRLFMALKAAGMAAWEWQPHASFWSNELYELLGIPNTTSASPETFFSCVYKEDLPGLIKAWDEAVQGEKEYDQIFRIVRPDGEIRWLAGVGEIVRDPQGNVTQIFGLNWDFTQEREGEEALRRSEKQAKQANVAKSAFLANMSHEIRTPMTAVLGYTDLLIGMEQEQEKAEYLQNIKRNGNFLLEIINDILDLSKIEAGKLEISQESFSLNEMLADLQSMMRVRAEEKNLEFGIEFISDLPERIETDPKRLRQILLNLISNAIKFTETGSVKVVINFLREKADAVLKFDVIDTGIGITPKQQSRLFQSFSQGDASVTRNYGGTGLGLAISQRLAVMLNGNISVSSKPGAGSTFSCTINLPVRENVKITSPNLEVVPIKAITTVREYQLQCRVLIVDDQRDVRHLTHLLLQRAGIETEFAEDGIQAVELIENQLQNGLTVDLILLDMQMPRMDGYQTAARLREIGFRRAIIALTADAMQGDMNRCLELGCDDYLSKPIDSNELLEMISRYTSQGRDL